MKSQPNKGSKNQTNKSAKNQKISAADFDEETYRQIHPDVAASIAEGMFKSGWDHYENYGREEGRSVIKPAPQAEPLPPIALPIAPVALPIAPVAPPIAKAQIIRAPQLSLEMPPCSLENIFLSSGGGLFVVGWVDDYSSRIEHLIVQFPDSSSIVISRDHIARVRRQDVEVALSSNRSHPYGFWGFIDGSRKLSAKTCDITLQLSGGVKQISTHKIRVVDDVELRNMAISYLSSASYFGNKHIQAIAGLEKGLGRSLVDFNKKISQSICASPYVERFGDDHRKFKGSIVVCLYGKAEYLFLQNALFSNLPGISDYEFIYVSNSPELSEQILRDAKIGHQIYGVHQSIVLLSGNAGFGAANNVASRYTRSNRLLIVNPDAFPRDQDWAQKHTEVVDSLPANQTTLFGVPLFYDDGSLMHGGMYFEVDSVPSMDDGVMTRRDFVRVEHYGKGAPPDSTKFLKSRPVPSVTGAYMSIDRHWFDQLNGFTEDFIFGHYEDADLCLKSLQAGRPAWLQPDIKLWHLEGKGSTRLPVHDGGSFVNRWLFSETWGAFIKDKLYGANPDLEQFVHIDAGMSDQVETLNLDRPKSAAKRHDAEPGLASLKKSTKRIPAGAR